MNTLVIDFETYDPHLEKLGSGWVHGDMQVLGAACKVNDELTCYLTNKDDIINLVNQASTLVAHNLQYDVGILLMWGVDISKKELIDTMILAKLVNNVRTSYSLDALSKSLLQSTKTDKPLGLAAIRHRLHKISKRKGPRTAQWKERTIKSAINFAKQNMHLMEKVVPSLVESYAIQDVDLTYRLYRMLSPEVSNDWKQKTSRVYKVLLKQRQKGIRIDRDRIIEVRDHLKDVEQEHYITMMQYVPENLIENFNPNSPKQLVEILDNERIDYPRTAKGNPSVTSEWLNSFDTEECHPFLASLSLYRKFQKARRDFCDAVLAAQELLPNGKKGRVYPEFKLFGARTGRFSCANPNIQQIPSRDKEIGPLVRSCYLPEEGEEWYSLDFSSQESRLQIHYAALLNVESGKYWACEYQNNPRLDLHALVAELADIDRTQAKTINLGLSYGMGGLKLAKSLKLTSAQARELTSKYHNAVPYLKELNEACKKSMSKKGYIKTLLGRQSYIDPPIYEKGKKITFEYKALNKLIQGSAADQVIQALLMIDEIGIDVLFSVHDEINVSAPSKEIAERVKKVMETCADLQVPMITDIGKGKNWAQAK